MIRMGAKVYDATSQAWKDATPQIYAGGGWSDTVGKVWDGSSQAWVDAWKKDENIILYDHGNSSTLFTNTTFNATGVPNNASYIWCFSGKYALIDLTNYNKIIWDSTWNLFGTLIVSKVPPGDSILRNNDGIQWQFGNTSQGFKQDTKEYDVSSFSGEWYALFGITAGMERNATSIIDYTDHYRTWHHSSYYHDVYYFAITK